MSTNKLYEAAKPRENALRIHSNLTSCGFLFMKKQRKSRETTLPADLIVLVFNQRNVIIVISTLNK